MVMRMSRIRLDCAQWPEPDLGVIDRVARLQLESKLAGRSLRLVNASAELRELIRLAGLLEVLCVEAERKAPQRKEPRRVQEERELGDLAI